VVLIQREDNVKRVMQKLTLQLPVDKEQLLGGANALGLNPKAIATLLRFTEIEIKISVDTKTGEVSGVKLV